MDSIWMKLFAHVGHQVIALRRVTEQVR
jgi:hypothetical protein